MPSAAPCAQRAPLPGAGYDLAEPAPSLWLHPCGSLPTSPALSCPVLSSSIPWFYLLYWCGPCRLLACHSFGLHSGRSFFSGSAVPLSNSILSPPSGPLTWGLQACCLSSEVNCCFQCLLFLKSLSLVTFLGSSILCPGRILTHSIFFLVSSVSPELLSSTCRSTGGTSLKN